MFFGNQDVENVSHVRTSAGTCHLLVSVFLLASFEAYLYAHVYVCVLVRVHFAEMYTPEVTKKDDRAVVGNVGLC